MPSSPAPLVSIVVASESDLPFMKEAADVLKEFGIPYETRVMSAHRTPDLAHEHARTLVDRGLQVVIAAAGGSAHLAGTIAAMTPLPVIGVPIVTDLMGGLDSLLSIVQMPAGVPVATVSANKAGPRNAALLAAQILGVRDPALRNRVANYKASLARRGAEVDQNLRGP